MEIVEAYKSLDGKIFTNIDDCIKYDKDLLLNKEIVDKINFSKFVEKYRQDKQDAIKFIKDDIKNVIDKNIEFYNASVGNLQYTEDVKTSTPKKSTKKVKPRVEERELLLDGDNK